MPKALYTTRLDKKRHSCASPQKDDDHTTEWLVKIISEYVPICEIFRFELFLLNKNLGNLILKFALVHQRVEGAILRNFWLVMCGRLGLLLQTERDRLGLGPVSMDRVYLHHLRSVRIPDLEHEIERDVVRTMPSHFLFSNKSPIGELNREKLQNVLFAISSAEPEIGYCQGMNFVVATLLLHLQMDEPDAFFMFLSLVRGYHFKYLYSPAVPLLPLRLFHFSRVVRAHVPSVWHHLNACTFSVEIFANQWFMTLFAYFLDPELVLGKVWSLFFLIGWEFLFQMGATILHILQPAITAMDVEEISTYMQKNQPEFGIPELISALTLFRITNENLENYTQQYLTEKILGVIRNGEHVMGLELVSDRHLRIDLSCFTSPNRPFEKEIEKRFVEVPMQSVFEIRDSVEFVSGKFTRLISQITQQIATGEKAINNINKRWNAIAGQCSRADDALKEAAKRKYLISIAMRTNIGMFPQMEECENEFERKKSVSDKLHSELLSAQHQLEVLQSEKNEKVVQLSKTVSESENVQNEIVYRSIQSAIDSFGSSFEAIDK